MCVCLCVRACLHVCVCMCVSVCVCVPTEQIIRRSQENKRKKKKLWISLPSLSFFFFCMSGSHYWLMFYEGLIVGLTGCTLQWDTAGAWIKVLFADNPQLPESKCDFACKKLRLPSPPLLLLVHSSSFDQFSPDIKWRVSWTANETFTCDLRNWFALIFVWPSQMTGHWLCSCIINVCCILTLFSVPASSPVCLISCCFCDDFQLTRTK